MNKKDILLKIKEYYTLDNDAKFARFLGISPQNLKHWYDRNTFDVNTLFTKCKEINPDWLLTGEGEMLRPVQTVGDISGSSVTGVNVSGSGNQITGANKELIEIIKQQQAQIGALIEIIKNNGK